MPRIFISGLVILDLHNYTRRSRLGAKPTYWLVMTHSKNVKLSLFFLFVHVHCLDFTGHTDIFYGSSECYSLFAFYLKIRKESRLVLRATADICSQLSLNAHAMYCKISLKLLVAQFPLSQVVSCFWVANSPAEASTLLSGPPTASSAVYTLLTIRHTLTPVTRL